jgi:hypothetical protein
MLYHWHELAPTSVPVAADARSTASDQNHLTIAYDAAAAIAHARGGPMRIYATMATTSAANDCDPDTIAMRLRSTGIGVADYRIRCARPSITDGALRTLARYMMILTAMRSWILGALPFLPHGRAHSAMGCSHTIVSNDEDDRPRVYNGA